MKKSQWILAATLLMLGTFARAQTVEYIHTDALGSPVAVTNASGAVIERTVYEPYGAVINRPITNGPGYTGHVLDAVTGLHYMQQRYYDPALGRFLSNDPVTATSVGANFNRYWYANNNPYAYIDPDGRCTGSIIKSDDGSCPYSGPLSVVGSVPTAEGRNGGGSTSGTAGGLFSGVSAEPQSPTAGGTQALFRACNGGTVSACIQLVARNQSELQEAMTFLESHYPSILSPFESDLPSITFDTSREFWVVSGGTTNFWTGSIVLSAGYNSTADLVGTLTHELLHSSDGVLGRAITNFQDRFLPTISPRDVGQRHTEIYMLSDGVAEMYQMLRGDG